MIIDAMILHLTLIALSPCPQASVFLRQLLRYRCILLLEIGTVQELSSHPRTKVLLKTCRFGAFVLVFLFSILQLKCTR
jgi:hypothetical protein